MSSRRYPLLFAGALLVVLFTARAMPAEEPATEKLDLPKVTFFYFDAPAVEWIVSAEPARLERHLASNAVSQGLLDSVSSAVVSPPESEVAAAQMTRWIESERTRFEQTRREAPRIAMAEAVIAYLRGNDFSIQRLVADLKSRSGATDVELVVIHLRDGRGEPAFKLKVVLVDPQIEVGKQGFNVDLQSPNANYTVVTYALGVALYNVQEIIHGNKPADESDENRSIEPLPLPPPAQGATAANRRSTSRSLAP